MHKLMVLVAMAGCMNANGNNESTGDPVRDEALMRCNEILDRAEAAGCNDPSNRCENDIAFPDRTGCLPQYVDYADCVLARTDICDVVDDNCGASLDACTAAFCATHSDPQCGGSPG